MATSPTWQLQEAKARLSELVQKALDEGPQMITRRGKASVVVIDAEELRRLQRPNSDFVDFLRIAPEIDLEIDRQRDSGRMLDL
ncbi:MAG TPA: type II toxin-antitoxin system Phd/YefM family antitoxin [Rectinemataceae bacterium]|nr:type II toxin-antitoxin system Phd/YefM family antitoxin [Rectinemataceae bacterium]